MGRPVLTMTRSAAGLRADWLLAITPRPGRVVYVGYGASLSQADALKALTARSGMLGDTAEQIRYFRQAVEIEPQSAAYQDSLGWALFKRGRDQESKEMLQKAATAKSAISRNFEP